MSRSVYDEDFEEHRSRKASDHTVDLTMSAEEARHKHEQQLEKSSDALKDVIKIEEGKDGKNYLLGFLPVPKGMEAPLNSVLNVAKPYLNREAGRLLYDKVSNLLIKYNRKDVAHSGGLWAAKIFSGVLIGAQPVTNLWRVYSDYSQERSELLTELAPAIEANKGSWKRNEIIRTAMDEIAGRAKKGLWRTAADAPTLIPSTMYALEDYAALASQKELVVKRAALASQPEAERRKAIADLAKNRREHINEEISALRKELEKDTSYQDKNGKPNLADIQAELDAHRTYLNGEYEQAARAANDPLAAIKLKQHEEDSKKDPKLLVMSAAELASGYLKSFTDDDGKSTKQINAYTMIKHLKQVIDDQCGSGRDDREDCDQSFRTRDADDIRVDGIKKGETLTLKEAIAEIINQNERDRERTIIGKVPMSQLQPAIDEIADVIASGRGKTDILLNLIGNGDLIKYNKGKREFASVQEVDKLVAEQLIVLSSREIIKKEEFYSNFEAPQNIQDTVKQNLEKMTGKEKAFFASLFPDDILEQEGLRKEKITELRKEAYAHEGIYNFVAANVIHLAAKSPEDIKKLNIPETSMQVITDLAGKIEDGDMKAVKQAVDGRDKSVIEAIRTAGLLEQTKGGEGQKYWANRTKEIPATRTKMAENKKQFAQKEAGEFRDGDQERDAESRDSRKERPARRSRSSEESADQDAPDGGRDDEGAPSRRASRFTRHDGHTGYAGQHKKSDSWGERSDKTPDYRTV